MKDHEFDIRIRQDGNRWCATFSNFVNLQESPAGFGEDVKRALFNLFANDKLNRVNRGVREATAPEA